MRLVYAPVTPRSARHKAEQSSAWRVSDPPRRSNFFVACQNDSGATPSAKFKRRESPQEISWSTFCATHRMAFFTPPVDPQTTKAGRSSPLRGPGCPLPGNTVCHAVHLVPLGNPKTMTSKQRESSKKRARRKENQKPKPSAKPPTKAAQKTKRRLQSLRRRAERQDRTPKLTRRDEHSSLAKSLGVRSLDLFRSFCPHESF